jgi:hypothetical protein
MNGRSAHDDPAGAAPPPGRRSALRQRLAADNGLLSLTARRAVDVRLIDTALALGSRLFVAVIPLSLLATAVTPVDDSFAEVIDRTLGLTGPGEEAARILFASPETVRSGASVFGLVVLLYTLTSYARGLQAVYLTVWGLPVESQGALRRRLLWVGGLALYVTVTMTLDGLESRARLDGLVGLVSGVVAVAFFTWTPSVLLHARGGVGPSRALRRDRLRLRAPHLARGPVGGGRGRRDPRRGAHGVAPPPTRSPARQRRLLIESRPTWSRGTTMKPIETTR